MADQARCARPQRLPTALVGTQASSARMLSMRGLCTGVVHCARREGLGLGGAFASSAEQRPALPTGLVVDLQQQRAEAAAAEAAERAAEARAKVEAAWAAEAAAKAEAAARAAAADRAAKLRRKKKQQREKEQKRQLSFEVDDEEGDGG